MKIKHIICYKAIGIVLISLMMLLSVTVVSAASAIETNNPSTAEVTRPDWLLVAIIIVDPDPAIGFVGDEFSFDGSCSTIGQVENYGVGSTADTQGDGQIVSYEWDFGDETNVSGEKVTHTYDNVGIFTVTLTITDNTNATDDTTVDVNITPDIEPPEQVTGLTVTNEDGTLKLTWNDAYDNVGVSHYNIYRDYDDDPFISLNTEYDDTDVFTGQTYTYQVSAVDKAENEGLRSEPKDCTSTGSNNPPVAVIESESYCCFLGEGIIFDGSNSYDPDVNIISYSWDFGDGNIGAGEVVSHVYEQVDTYTVSLTVTDNDGISNTSTAVVFIVDSGTWPTADAGGPYFGHIDEPIFFDGSSSNDSDGTITNYTWDFDDETNGFGVSPTHTYTTNGTFIMTLTVIDSDDLIDTNKTFVVVSNENRCPNKPTIIGPVNGSVEVEYEYSVSATNSESDMVRYIINWYDSVITTTPLFPSGTTATTRHMWNSAGTYYVTVYAEDEYGTVSEIVNLTVVIIDKENTENMLLDQTGGNIGFLSGNGSEGIIYITIALIAAIGVVLFWYRRKIFGNKNLLCNTRQERNPQDSMGRLSVTQEPSYMILTSYTKDFNEGDFTQSSIDENLGMFCPT